MFLELSLCSEALPAWHRLDYVRGFHGSHVRDYVRATKPSFVVGEFWDSLSYNGGLPDHNQVSARLAYSSVYM